LLIEKGTARVMPGSERNDLVSGISAFETSARLLFGERASVRTIARFAST